MIEKVIKNKIGLFLINPFLSAINSLKDIRDGVSHKFLYLWFLVFGIGFCAFNESADSFRYVENFLVEHSYSWSQYIAVIKEWLTFDSNIKDIYTVTVNFLVGRFSDNYHWTYLIYAAVFGFFYIKSLRIFLRHETVSNNLVFYALLFMLCYSNPIFNINGVRFWTASWIGVYVSLKLFIEKDYSKLPLLLLMPLIHDASIIWVFIILIAWLLQNCQNFAIIIYVLSAFVSATSFLGILSDYTYLFPSIIQKQIFSYTESEAALERMSDNFGVPYANFLNALPSYFQILMSVLLIINRKIINLNKESGKLLTITLTLAAITNFLSGIPSMGRFSRLVIPFWVILWASNYPILKKYNKIFLFVPIVYAYSLLYWYRHMTSVTEIFLYLMPAPLSTIYYLFL